MNNETGWIPREVFEAYCGPGSEKLLAYYDASREKKQLMRASLNWLAILLLPAWFGYRKQWVTLTVFTILIAASSVLEIAYRFEIPSGAFVGIGIALGVMANGFLLTTANSLYHKLKQQQNSDAQIIEQLRDKGSKSIPLAFVGVIVNIGVLIGAVILSEILFGVTIP